MTTDQTEIAKQQVEVTTELAQVTGGQVAGRLDDNAGSSRPNTYRHNTVAMLRAVFNDYSTPTKREEFVEYSTLS